LTVDGCACCHCICNHSDVAYAIVPTLTTFPLLLLLLLLQGSVTDMREEKVVQPLLVTSSALTLATECVRMILKVRVS
jgi:hypothetical protein